MTTKPLEYENRKIILQYLDPNTRIMLNRSCPSLYHLNKLIPLHISKLQLSPFNHTINDTSYRLGIIVHFTHGEAPVMIKRENDAGGFRRDNGGYDQIIEQHHRTQLAVFEVERKELENVMEEKRKRVAEIENSPALKELCEQELKLLKKQIRDHESNPPEFKYSYRKYVQLTINSPDRGLNVERTSYCLPLSDSEDCFLKRIFSGFKKVNITKLIIKAGSPYGDISYPQFPRLFSVKELELDGNIRKMFNYLRPSLAENTGFDVLVLRRDTNYNQDFIKSAKVLVLTGSADFNSLFKLSNTRVLRKGSTIDSRQAKGLIDDWRRKMYPIGRQYSLEVMYVEKNMRLVENLVSLEGGERKIIDETRNDTSPHCATFPMNNLAELNVYVRCSRNYPDVARSRTYRSMLNVIFEIHPKGYATLL